MSGVVVAIDGPAGAGKSTVAELVAARLGFVYLNSGLMYRALAWAALRQGLRREDGAGLGRLAGQLDINFSPDGKKLLLNGEDRTAELTTPEISSAASMISAHPQVRQRMVDRQRRLGANGRIVMEGRDIGTYVFPQARYKIYLDADLRTRAERRARELRSRGLDKNLEQLQTEIARRDGNDTDRVLAPLKRDPRAFYLDSSGLSIDEVVVKIVEYIKNTV